MEAPLLCQCTDDGVIPSHLPSTCTTMSEPTSGIELMSCTTDMNSRSTVVVPVYVWITMMVIYSYVSEVRDEPRHKRGT